MDRVTGNDRGYNREFLTQIPMHRPALSECGCKARFSSFITSYSRLFLLFCKQEVEGDANFESNYTHHMTVYGHFTIGIFQHRACFASIKATKR